MRKMLHMVSILGLICLGSAASVAAVYIRTKPIIEERRIQRIQEMAQSVLPGAKFHIKDGGASDRFEGFDEKGNPTGVVYVVSARGYSSMIGVVVGLNRDGEILGVKIYEERETPGLGTKITSPEFCKQFVKTTVRQIMQGGFKLIPITGATISSKGVASAVREAAKRLTKEPFYHPAGK